MSSSNPAKILVCLFDHHDIERQSIEIKNVMPMAIIEHIKYRKIRVPFYKFWFRFVRQRYGLPGIPLAKYSTNEVRKCFTACETTRFFDLFIIMGGPVGISEMSLKAHAPYCNHYYWKLQNILLVSLVI